MKYTGKIITLAFPDTFVKLSDERLLSLMVKSRLVGKGNYVKAGHAAMILIENHSGNAQYFDFGRYVTPPGKGRVRGASTDVELEIPFKARFTTTGQIQNLNDFLIWLDENPQKTHGSGRLVAGVCDYIFYDNAMKYVTTLHNKGSIPYKAFPSKGASNCARLVTDTILMGTDNFKIRRRLYRNKSFSPSTVGNVEKSAGNNTIYEVFQGEVRKYTNTAFRENLTNYFDRNVPIENHSHTDISAQLKGAHYLSGIGAGAYFRLKRAENKESSISDNRTLYEIQRFTDSGELDFTGLFKVDEHSFNFDNPYSFTYDSNCLYCHIIQGEQIYRFDRIKELQQNFKDALK